MNDRILKQNRIEVGISIFYSANSTYRDVWWDSGKIYIVNQIKT